MKFASCLSLRTTICLFVGLVSIILSVEHSEARINCQSEIYRTQTNNPNDRFKVGYCLVKLGQFGQGASTLNGLEQNIPILADYVLYYKAAGYENLGDWAKASAAFNRVLTEYPDTALKRKTLERLGNIYTQNGDYTNAISIYKSLYADEVKAKKKTNILFNLGETYEKMGNYTSAIDIYKRVWVEYGYTKPAKEAIEKAKLLSEMHGLPLQITSQDYLKRGDNLFKKAVWGQAVTSYQNVPAKSAETTTNMGIAMVNSGRLNEALSVLRTVNSPKSIFWQAKVMSKQGLDTEASNTYYKIHLLYPQSPLAPEGMYNAARLYQINNNTQKAINLYDELIRQYPRNEYAEDGAWNLGMIYYKRGMLREAHGTFSAFTESTSSYNSSNAKYWKARTLEKQGNTQEANAVYRDLAMSSTPTYHSYMAQKKTGIAPNYPRARPELLSTSSATSTRKQKADLLIQLGMLEDANVEIEKMQEEAQTTDDNLTVSLLYAQVDDFYNSIKIAQGIGLPNANSLSFPKGYQDIVSTYARQYGVDELLVYSVIREESRFQKEVRSPANAVGLMQLIPPTARAVARQIGMSNFSTEMLTIPKVNIQMGIFYLKQVMDEFGGDVELALASYNAGPHRAAKWKARFYGLPKDEFIEEIPFRETRNYIRRILRSYGAYKAIYGANAGGYVDPASKDIEQIN